MKISSIIPSVVFVIALPAANIYAKDDRAKVKPNVIIIITDDQGKGDLGCLGNKIIKTPHIDKFYSDAVRLTNYHVSPTSAPTRAALMTGRYTNRTNAFHTVGGRDKLYEDEKILAEVFKENGYSTAMYGKWHLGDNYPSRPEDKGFDEVVRHGGGGIGQGPDYWGNDYFDDIYWHNGSPEKYEGYCTDVFFKEAITFIENNKDLPFFCYISTNAPHGPLHVPEEYLDLYKDYDIPKNLKRFYGMITNIDDNFKKLEDRLRELKILDNTIIIFTTDNGTAGGLVYRDGKIYGHDAGLRGKKNTVYEGGHRVPFFIRWKGGSLDGGRDIDHLTAHIDVFPTFVELCDMSFKPSKSIDGTSISPLLCNEKSKWEERVLFVDSQRTQNLVKWKKCAIMSDRWRLIDGVELYDVAEDLAQTTDLSNKYPEIVLELRSEYEKWWASLMKEGVNERYAYTIVGTDCENPVRINSHELHTGMLGVAWHQKGVLGAQIAKGLYKIEFASTGKYRITLCRYPLESGLYINSVVHAKKQTIEVSEPLPKSKDVNFSRARIYIGDIDLEKNISSNDRGISFDIEVQSGKYDFEAILYDELDRVYPAYYLYIERK